METDGQTETADTKELVVVFAILQMRLKRDTILIQSFSVYDVIRYIE